VHFRQEYNIAFKYRFEDIESDYRYNLVPAERKKSEILAQIIKYAWLEAYREEVGETDSIGTVFLRKYSPKIIHLIGSKGYNSDGTVLLGSAEGGVRVSLYDVNDIDIDNISDPLLMDRLTYKYFHVMHHEFAHIFHQTINYDAAFKEISAGEYVGSIWNTISKSTALSKGFMSPYSMDAEDEDFVELYAFYVTNSADWWEEQLRIAGDKGRADIEKKIAIVKNYFVERWGINLDSMREIVARRAEDVPNLNFETF